MDANPQVENLRCSTLKKNQGIEEISFIPSDTGEKKHGNQTCTKPFISNKEQRTKDCKNTFGVRQEWPKIPAKSKRIQTNNRLEIAQPVTHGSSGKLFVEF